MRGVYQVTLASWDEVVAAAFHCGGPHRRGKALCELFPSKHGGCVGLCFSNVLSFRQPASVQRL